MKLFHYRMGRSMLLLAFNMTLVFVAAFLVLVNLQAREEMEESKRGFYSTEAEYLVCEDTDWSSLEDLLSGGKCSDHPPGPYEMDPPAGSSRTDRYGRKLCSRRRA